MNKQKKPCGSKCDSSSNSNSYLLRMEKERLEVMKANRFIKSKK